jgi:dolichol kinase
MEKGELFRKAFHICAPVFLTYYLVPDDVWGFVPNAGSLLSGREVVLITVLAIVLASEALRLRMGRRVFGMRPYEQNKMAAHAWAGLGITIGFLFFPQPLVVAIVFGMAWVDPLIGVLRKARPKLYPIVPLVVYMLIVAVALGIQTDISPLIIINLALIAACAAILCESPRLEHLDDDFLLLTIPLAALWLADFLFASAIGFLFS